MNGHPRRAAGPTPPPATATLDAAATPATEAGIAAAALQMRGFGLAYRRPEGDLTIVADVTLDVPAGGFYLLVGESGSGKSSLLHLLTGLWEPREPPPRVRGELCVLGLAVQRRYPNELRTRVAAVLQEPALLDELTVRGNVELALRVAGRSPKLAPALLSQAGLPEPPSRVAALSGGMRKRVAVARARRRSGAVLVRRTDRRPGCTRRAHPGSAAAADARCGER